MKSMNPDENLLLLFTEEKCARSPLNMADLSSPMKCFSVEGSYTTKLVDDLNIEASEAEAESVTSIPPRTDASAAARLARVNLNPLVVPIQKPSTSVYASTTSRLAPLSICLMKKASLTN